MPNDTRCLGGQKTVVDLMANHYSALTHIRPTLNTRQAPRQHISKIGKRPKTTQGGLLNGDKFNE